MLTFIVSIRVRFPLKLKVSYLADLFLLLKIDFKQTISVFNTLVYSPILNILSSYKSVFHCLFEQHKILN